MLPLFSFATEMPTQLNTSFSAAYFLKLGLALLLVLAMFLSFAWMMRRFNGYQSTAKGDLRVVTGLNLGTREKLVIVQVGEEQILLGVTPGNIKKLHRLDVAIEDSKTVTPGEFSQKLKSVLKNREQ